MKFILTLHALCAFVVFAVRTALIVTILSRETLSGVFGTETEVMDALSYIHIAFLRDSSEPYLKKLTEKRHPCVADLRDCLSMRSF